MHFVSACCSDEICGMCYREGEEVVVPATHKVAEEQLPDEPQERHNWAQYV